LTPGALVTIEMWLIKRFTNGASLVSLSLLIPKILPFFTKRDGFMDGRTDVANTTCMPPDLSDWGHTK